MALKILPAYFVSDDERLRRFQTEARAASALNHANILTIYEVGQSAEIFFIAAEFIDGSTIRELFRAGRLSLGEVLEVVDQILCGLTAAHAGGIVHRDIKPENVMRRNDGMVKILDFGIAKLLERSSSQTSTETEFGLLLGTIGYMSPEQVRAWPVDERSDLWSCGVVLYEMLTQRRPFVGIANADVIVAILEREPEPLFGISEPADPVLRTIQSVVNKALRKDPAERYQTAAEMRADLAQIKQELAVEKDLGPRRGFSLETNLRDLSEISWHIPPRKRRREIGVLIGFAVLLALFAGTFLYHRYKSRSTVPPAAPVAKKPYLQMSPAE
ncbi:MAG: serine/threonine-protein kinase, partial [Pseudonocardiaceae bacterium]